MKLSKMAMVGLTALGLCLHAWTQLDGETKTHFEADGRTGYKAGALLGRMFNGKTGASVKVEVPFGGYREGDVTLKVSLIRVK